MILDGAKPDERDMALMSAQWRIHAAQAVLRGMIGEARTAIDEYEKSVTVRARMLKVTLADGKHLAVPLPLEAATAAVTSIEEVTT